MLNILWRSMKWRFKNPISFVVTILQPFLWLVLYSSIANQTMNNININNYTAFILPGVIVLVVFSSCSSGGIINFIKKAVINISTIISRIPPMPDSILTEKNILTIHKIVTSMKETKIASNN